MRGKMAAGVLMALALLIPAAPAAAQAAAPGLDASCQTVERKVFKDLRQLITIDLDTANEAEVRRLAYQILAETTAESLPVLPPALEEKLKGSADDLRAFLKKGWLAAWAHDLRISIGRTMGDDAGANVKAAANKVLDGESYDAYLAYLNEGLYDARALDCATKPTPTPTVTPTATPTVTPSATSSATSSAPVTTPASSSAPATPAAGAEDNGGEGGGLPVTGTATGLVAAIGGLLLLLGAAGYVIGRRRRSRFVA
ncbi:LPXTG cell wall anchor domain-containing protein [Paractinoplanes atraurantiacus]|uniref:LPXTG-motif cell wall anchor domain-containing protein n=1 Tax=Paractinoplanes atraurantiacus TaxID=1036182 RepID=A0A285FU92_9ACTN|nr:LPXTG cell wall anchor domain-containing protein [Actinoplanes atraurantiacus]SNY14815.1 LPXTG-motif cell wall anchor domain-containing protein [Actinoplanes atraurantiacus]